MIDVHRLKTAAGGLMAAALLSDGWESALSRLADSAGARDAVLMRNDVDRMVAGIATEGVAEAVTAFAAGRAPPNARYAAMRVNAADGFRVDHDDFTDDQLAADPFYNEFLRPIGLFWHANAVLSGNRRSYLELSFKRRIEFGPYQRADAVALNCILPEVRAAAAIAGMRLDALAQGMADVFRGRGSMVFKLNERGRLAEDESGEWSRASPLTKVDGRLKAVERAAQAALDEAISAAIAVPGRTGILALSSSDGAGYFLQVHPVPGRAHEVFSTTAAVAVLIAREPPAERRADISLVGQAFGLTEREIDIAWLLCNGFDLVTISRRLKVSSGTVKTHLKGAFEKTGTRRQAELVALISQLKP